MTAPHIGKAVANVPVILPVLLSTATVIFAQSSHDAFAQINGRNMDMDGSAPEKTARAAACVAYSREPFQNKTRLVTIMPITIAKNNGATIANSTAVVARVSLRISTPEN